MFVLVDAGGVVVPGDGTVAANEGLAPVHILDVEKSVVVEHSVGADLFAAENHQFLGRNHDVREEAARADLEADGADLAPVVIAK